MARVAMLRVAMLRVAMLRVAMLRVAMLRVEMVRARILRVRGRRRTARKRGATLYRRSRPADDRQRHALFQQVGFARARRSRPISPARSRRVHRG
jgi:hypothetical protein